MFNLCSISPCYIFCTNYQSLHILSRNISIGTIPWFFLLMPSRFTIFLIMVDKNAWLLVLHLVCIRQYLILVLILHCLVFSIFLWCTQRKKSVYNFQRFITYITNTFWFTVFCLPSNFIYTCNWVWGLLLWYLSHMLLILVYRFLFNCLISFLNLLTSVSSLPLHRKICSYTRCVNFSKAVAKVVSIWLIISIVSIF